MKKEQPKQECHMKKEQPKQECHMKNETSLYICHHSKQDRIAAWRKSNQNKNATWRMKHHCIFATIVNKTGLLLEEKNMYLNLLASTETPYSLATMAARVFLNFIIMTFIMLSSNVILRGHFLVLCSYCSSPPPPPPPPHLSFGKKYIHFKVVMEREDYLLGLQNLHYVPFAEICLWMIFCLSRKLMSVFFAYCCCLLLGNSFALVIRFVYIKLKKQVSTVIGLVTDWICT